MAQFRVTYVGSGCSIRLLGKKFKPNESVLMDDKLDKAFLDAAQYEADFAVYPLVEPEPSTSLKHESDPLVEVVDGAVTEDSTVLPDDVPSAITSDEIEPLVAPKLEQDKRVKRGKR